MKSLLLLSLILFSVPAYADKDHEEEHDEKHGHEEEHELPAGITFFNDETGEFSLRDNVFKNFGIVVSPVIKENSSFKVPSVSVVSSLKVTSVFILKNNIFKNTEVKVTRTSLNFSYVTSPDDLADLNVVIKGSNFLKTILLSLEEGPSEGHGH